MNVLQRWLYCRHSCITGVVVLQRWQYYRWLYCRGGCKYRLDCILKPEQHKGLLGSFYLAHSLPCAKGCLAGSTPHSTSPATADQRDGHCPLSLAKLCDDRRDVLKFAAQPMKLLFVCHVSVRHAMSTTCVMSKSCLACKTRKLVKLFLYKFSDIQVISKFGRAHSNPSHVAISSIL